MDLFKLKELIEDTKIDINFYKKERSRIESKLMPGGSSLNSISVQGGLHDRDKALLEYTQIGILLDDAIKKLNNLIDVQNEKYKNYISVNDYDKQIYIEKRLFKWKDSKISSKHNGLSRSQIHRIVKKIEKE